MSNPVLNIVISQGFDFEETFQSTEANGTASNLAGFTASSVLKKHSGASSSTPFSVTITGNTGTDFIFIYEVVIPGVTNAIPSTNLDTLPDDETNLTS